MQLTQPARRSPAGPLTAADILLAPSDVFERLRHGAAWFWPLCLAIVLFTIGLSLTQQARIHATVGTMQQQMTDNPRLAALPEYEKARILDSMKHPSSMAIAGQMLLATVILLLGMLFQTALMTLINLLGGRASFAKLWSVQANIAIVWGLSMLTLGIIAQLRGPDAFPRAEDLANAVPGIANLLHVGGAAGTFVGAFTLFALWAYALMALALRVTARAKWQAAIGLSSSLFLVAAALPALLRALTRA